MKLWQNRMSTGGHLGCCQYGAPVEHRLWRPQKWIKQHMCQISCLYTNLQNAPNFSLRAWTKVWQLQWRVSAFSSSILHCFDQRFPVSYFLCSCSYHLEFASLGYSKQFYHILFSPPTQNLLLQSSFLASLVPHRTPAQHLRFILPIADIVRFTNSFTYLLTYLCLGLSYLYRPVPFTFQPGPFDWVAAPPTDRLAPPPGRLTSALVWLWRCWLGNKTDIQHVKTTPIIPQNLLFWGPS